MSFIVTRTIAVGGQMPAMAGSQPVGKSASSSTFEETLAQMRIQSTQTMAQVTTAPVIAEPQPAPTNAIERNGPIRSQLENLEAQWSKAGEAVAQINGETNPTEFLRLQGEMYQLEEQMAVFSKAVEQGTSGVKQILQMQI